MQKKLVIINGTMGVGKTTICRNLYKKIENCVWLDGDWCWMMNPFHVTEESKRMVEDNITYILRNFLNNSSFEYVIFSWVIHYEKIFDIILDKLRDCDFELYKLTILCSEEALRERMFKDGREQDLIESSVERLKLYQFMDTIKIDTTNTTVSETVDNVLRIIGYV